MRAVAVEKLAAFFKTANPLLYKKGETILRGDEIPNGIFYINKGYVRNYLFSENGDEFTFIISRKGDFFPVAWTFNKSRKPYFFQSITPCIIYKRSREDFLTFLNENPDVLLYSTDRLTKRVDGLLERMGQMAFGNAYQKVCSILLILSERFGQEENGILIIKIPLTHKDIANLLGVARETVSVEIAKLKKENIIQNAGKHIRILNPKKLKEDSVII